MAFLAALAANPIFTGVKSKAAKWPPWAALGRLGPPSNGNHSFPGADYSRSMRHQASAVKAAPKPSSTAQDVSTAETFGVGEARSCA